MKSKDLFRILVCLTIILLLASCRNSNEQKSDARVRQQPKTEKTGVDTRAPVWQTHRRKLAIGIALVNGVLIYRDSSTAATVVDTLNLADYILTHVYRNEHDTIYHFNGWTPVEDLQGNGGWVRYDNLVVNENFSTVTSPKDSYYDELLWFADDSGKPDLFKNSQDPTKGKYPDLILKVAERLELIRASGDTIPAQFDLEEGDSHFVVGAAVLLPYAKSKAYLAKGEVHNAIVELQKVIKEYPKHHLYWNRAGPRAALELADIYLVNLKDTTEALAQYHFIIHNFPEIELGNCDENSWDAEWSAMSIMRLLKNDPDRLCLESKRIITESRDHKVKLLGYVGMVRALGLQGRFTQMLDTALVAIALYPNARYPDVDSTAAQELEELSPLNCPPVNYSNSVVSVAFVVLEEKGDVTAFPAFADKIATRFGQYEIGAAAALRKAQYADRTNGNKAEVIALYRRVVDGFADFHFDDRMKDDKRVESLGKDMAQERLKELSNQSYSEVTMTKHATELRAGFGEQFPVLKTLPAGTRVNFLYTEEKLVSEYIIKYSRFKPQWAKIETTDGTIGWVLLNQIK